MFSSLLKILCFSQNKNIIPWLDTFYIQNMFNYDLLDVAWKLEGSIQCLKIIGLTGDEDYFKYDSITNHQTVETNLFNT